MASSKQYNVYKGILDIPSYTQQLNKLNRLEADEIFKILCICHKEDTLFIEEQLKKNFPNCYIVKSNSNENF